MRRATGIAREGKEEIAALWQGYRQTQNPCLKEALIKRYVHLVRYVAGRMRIFLPSHLRMEEAKAGSSAAFGPAKGEGGREGFSGFRAAAGPPA
jgi:hypothetical protein